MNSGADLHHRESPAGRSTARTAFRFVLTIGIVNLFADLTYEGARSLNGAFLASLGASPAAVGLVAGFGELIGYSFRSVTGFLADRTHRYWFFAFTGYAINMLAVPALALAGNWQTAAMLMIAERTGRAIRKPTMETMISHAGKELGHGWVFGLNEFLDQFGATIGPLIVASAFAARGNYGDGYAVLLISALICLGTLVIARIKFPKPDELNARHPHLPAGKGLGRQYRMYLFAGMLIAAGYADFSLIAYHFQLHGVVSTQMIPVLYAAAMATAGLSGLLFGKLLDRRGGSVAVTAFAVGMLFAPLTFLGNAALASAGMVCWGVGAGAQDSLLKARLAAVVPAGRRATAFGLFDSAFGIAWFAGSAAMGFLYAASIPFVVIFSLGTQLLALPLLAAGSRNEPGPAA